MDLWIVFLTGLTVGGLTCLAVQGGLLASVIAVREEEEIKKGINRSSPVAPTLAFLISKLAAYTVLGFLLGAFGSAVGISQNTQIIMQFIAGVYMILIALNLLNVHPIFRYAVIQPPRFITRQLRNKSKSKDIFAPMLVGIMTILIPCGTTLAMEALAVSSANPFTGSIIMATFVLGTFPLFFGIGWLTGLLGHNFKGKFLRIAAIAVLYLGITSINGSLIAINFPINSQTIAVLITNSQRPDTNTAKKADNLVEITVTSGGYFPDSFTVKKGSPVKLRLIAKDAYSCAAAFRIPSLGISKNLRADEVFETEFVPKETGKILFSCSMGMYTGVIDVI